MKGDILSFAGFGYIFPERFDGKVLLSYRDPAVEGHEDIEW